MLEHEDNRRNRRAGTKSAAYVALFAVIREKIRDHETGIGDLWKCYHAAEKQTEEDLKRGGLDDLS